MDYETSNGGMICEWQLEGLYKRVIVAFLFFGHFRRICQEWLKKIS
jgi:hypothetical protein